MIGRPPHGPLAEALAFREGESFQALPIADRDRYLDLARTACEFLGIDADKPLTDEYEEGYNDALGDAESALAGLEPGRWRRKPKAEAA